VENKNKCQGWRDRPEFMNGINLERGRHKKISHGHRFFRSSFATFKIMLARV
jgi:hypothetical protein